SAAIAPTYAVKTNQGSIAWPTATAAFAAAVNRNAQLRALRDTYAATLADLARTEADVLRGNTWEVTQAANAGTFYRYLANSDGSAILHQLGARLGETATAAEYWGPELSYERIDDQLGRASVILCVEVGSAPLLGQQLWKRLPAARAGHVYTSDLIFPASYSGAIALLDFIRTVCTELRAPSS
ncbi:MAG: hypothetical protein J0H43_12225, partial [Actinobacteria bacterium]|nr:hypothetical protein [Actinomycetota bacterium]